MEIILVLLGGYLLSKLFNGSSSSPKEEDENLAFGVRGQAIQSMMLGGNHTATKTSYSDCRTKRRELKTSCTCLETLYCGECSPFF